MADKIIQCCYSNLVLETGATGWTVAATSSDVSSAMAAEYAKIQDSNVCNSEPLGKDGKALNMFEIVTKDKYVYLTRITYGLMVPGGRKNNMLSHTYLFPLSDGALTDPNEFLTVTDANFTGDIDEARQIRSAFDRSEPYTMASAFAAAGIDDERYLQLIHCLHMRKEQRRTLYIHTRKGEEVIRPLIYLMWNSIPLSMRKDFSCASANINENTTKTIIFSDQHLYDDLYFDLDTGDNNILDSRSVKKYSRWGYVDHYAKAYNTVDGVEFFSKLDEIAVKLGDAKAAKNKVLRIAYQIMTSEGQAMDFDTLRVKLYEALLLPVQGTEYLDNYLADLLADINATGERLDDEVEQELISKLNTETSERLTTEGDRYMINRITHLSPREGAGFLADMSPAKFKQYAKALTQTGKADEYLDYYFAEHYEIGEPNWIYMDRFLDEINSYDVDQLPLTSERWMAECLEVFRTQMQKAELEPLELLEAYRVHIEYFANNQNLDAQMNKAKCVYWDQFDMGTYSYQKVDEYKQFIVKEHNTSSICNAVNLMLGALVVKVKCPQNELYKQAKQHFVTKYSRGLSDEVRQHIYKCVENIMQPYLEKPTYVYLCEKSHLEILAGKSYSTQIHAVLNALQEKDLEQYRTLYDAEIRDMLWSTQKEELIHAFNRCLCAYMQGKKLFGAYSLDPLLLIGGSMFANPFEILDNMSLVPEEFDILAEEDPAVLFENSCMLKQDDVMQNAEEYVSQDTDGAEFVREWLDEFKRYKKALKKASKESSRGFGLFRGGADEQEGMGSTRRRFDDYDEAVRRRSERSDASTRRQIDDGDEYDAPTRRRFDDYDEQIRRRSDDYDAPIRRRSDDYDERRRRDDREERGSGEEKSGGKKLGGFNLFRKNK